MTDHGQDGDGLYIVLISVHGLIRGHDLELGRDADTGGQVLYVVELARHLARHPRVGRVDLLTRRVVDPKVDDDYAVPLEPLADNAFLVRVSCGPRRYLRKEVLWPHLDSFVDNAVQHIGGVGRVPDLVHGHYADAGYVGARLSALVGAPLIQTGHSLGREKQRRLMDQGMKPETIESQYNISQRIEAEESALDAANLIIASTRQEVEEQYSRYENYQPERMVVIPPGVDLSRFHPPKRRRREAPPIRASLERFLRDPKRPMVLALSRPDYRKNIPTLVRAFGEHPDLRRTANLVVIAGTRDDIQAFDKGSRDVLIELLLLIDRYDLYGIAAYPKHHEGDDVPDLYRLAASTGGVFVNPAFTEPFGLTLIEAAASGLPVVATNDGGPQDIIDACRNGLLVDPNDAAAMSEAIAGAVTDRKRWRQWSRSGVQGAHRHFSWESHVQRYLKATRTIVRRHRKARVNPVGTKSRLPMVDRLLVCGLDWALTGDGEALAALIERIQGAGGRVGFGVASGRQLDQVLSILKKWGVPMPDLLLAGMGTEVRYGHRRLEDSSWRRHIDYRWQPDALESVLRQVPGLKLQPKREQGRFKLSFHVDPHSWPGRREVVRLLRRQDLHANVIYSDRAFLDILPIRASLGLALRYLATKWEIPLERVLVAGGSGNAEDMLRGNTLAVVVGNHDKQLDRLKGRPRVYFAEGRHARGILEGIDHYDFLGRVSIPGEEDNPEPEQLQAEPH